MFHRTGTARIRSWPGLVVLAGILLTVSASPAISRRGFQRMQQNIRVARTDTRRLELVRRWTVQNRFRAWQAAKVIGLLDYAASKTAALRILAPKIQDPQNESAIIAAFGFDSSKREARIILARERRARETKKPAPVKRPSSGVQPIDGPDRKDPSPEVRPGRGGPAPVLVIKSAYGGPYRIRLGVPVRHGHAWSTFTLGAGKTAMKIRRPPGTYVIEIRRDAFRARGGEPIYYRKVVLVRVYVRLLRLQGGAVMVDIQRPGREERMRGCIGNLLAIWEWMFPPQPSARH